MTCLGKGNSIIAKYIELTKKADFASELNWNNEKGERIRIKFKQDIEKNELLRSKSKHDLLLIMEKLPTSLRETTMD